MTYQGHKNYNYWNVSHWLHNDDSLLDQMRFAMRSYSDKDKATRYLLTLIPSATPDGVVYTFRNVRQALKD